MIIRPNKRQVRLFADKGLDLANLILIGLTLGQLVSGTEMNLVAGVFGIFSTGYIYWVVYHATRN